MGSTQGPPASRAVLRHFLTAWSNWAGLPGSLQVDRGKEFIAQFADYLKTFGVEQEVMPLEAPWKNGRVEKAGGLWKDLFERVVHETQIDGLQDVIIATAIVTQTRNSFPRTSGYSPNQWVLGKSEIRLPGSILVDEEAERLEVLEATENPGFSVYERGSQGGPSPIGHRRSCSTSAPETKYADSWPIPSGKLCLLLSGTSAARCSDNISLAWTGESHRRGASESPSPRRWRSPTEGGQPHSYWLRYGATVVLVAGEQLRFASEDELLAARSIPQEILMPPYSRGARGFADLRAQPLLPAQQARELQEESRVEAFVLGYLSRSLLWCPRRVSR